MKKFYFLFKKSFFSSTKRLLRNRNFNFYDVLGLDQDCSNEEIKSAYMKLAKQYHPDINKSEGAEEKFKSITSAYEALNNQRNRDLYDAYMYSDPNSADGDYDFFKRGKDDDAEEFEKSRWDKYYENNKNKKESEFWGKAKNKEQNKQKFEDEFIKDFESVFNYNFKKKDIRGDDIKLEISISLDDSYTGCVKIIEVNRSELCKLCKGTRTSPGFKISKCLACSGTGKKHSPLTGIKNCPTCSGKGILIKNPCK